MIWPYFDSEYCIYQSLTDSANIKFDLDLDHSGKPDLRNYLLFGEKSLDLNSRKAKVAQSDRLYAQGGYCFMYDQKQSAKLVFDVGRIGDHLLSAHGHSDLLHFTFELGGFPFIIDPGTFQYHSNYTFWRNYFRGIYAHNTISVDDCHHAMPATRMSWINKPHTTIVNYSSTKTDVLCVAEHDGFNMGRSGTIHRRSINMNRTNHSIVIQDHLIKRGNTNSRAKFLLHFHPAVKVEHKEDTVFLGHGGKNLSISNPHFVHAQFFRGDEAQPLGWFSEKFGVKTPTTTLLTTVHFNESLVLTTVIDYSQQ